MKKIILFTISLFLLNIVIVCAEQVTEIPATEIPPYRIRIGKDENGCLEDINYVVSSTRLNDNSKITYRTDKIYVDLGKYKFVIPSDGTSKLADITPKSKNGTVWNLVSVKKSDLENFIRDNIPLKDQAEAEEYLKNPEKIEIGASISILKNGNEVDKIESIEEVANVATKWNFNPIHITDMESRFLPAESNKTIMGDPVEKSEDPRDEGRIPKTGLRPGFFREESTEDND
ncbi:hypothetical protein [Wukongibacter baidiensis]